jgi:hypothetical protein
LEGPPCRRLHFKNAVQVGPPTVICITAADKGFFPAGTPSAGSRGCTQNNQHTPWGYTSGEVKLWLYRRPDSGRLILPAGLACPTCDAIEELAQALVEAALTKLRLSVIDVSRELA